MNARTQLQSLQFEQLEHDKLFHPDIICLPAQRRACHMVLHFAKYAGKLTHAKQTQNRKLLVATVIDCFIISLVTANIFNKNISAFKSISKFVDNCDINDIARNFNSANQASKEDVFTFASENITIESGKMAKAIESLDHLENYSYVDSLLGSLEKIVDAVLLTSLFTNLDLPDLTRNRLIAVEKKSIFYSKYRNSHNTSISVENN